MVITAVSWLGRKRAPTQKPLIRTGEEVPRAPCRGCRGRKGTAEPWDPTTLSGCDHTSCSPPRTPCMGSPHPKQLRHTRPPLAWPQEHPLGHLLRSRGSGPAPMLACPRMPGLTPDRTQRPIYQGDGHCKGSPLLLRVFAILFQRPSPKIPPNTRCLGPRPARMLMWHISEARQPAGRGEASPPPRSRSPRGMGS